MEYAEFVNGIDFTLLQPELPMDRFVAALSWNYPTSILEMMNTHIPGKDKARTRELSQLLDMPRMSTLAIASALDRAVASMPPETCFVNVGVWHGFTLFSAMANNPDKRCIGIDNFSEFGGPRAAFLQSFERKRSVNHSFYDLDYREYFKEKHTGKIGVYLYDGEHSYANQLEGLRVAEPFFADGCFVFVDDTNCEDPRRATLDFVAGSSSSYEIVFDAKTCQNCHPTFWNGLMVLRQA